jgi:AcrR family transcriptional regulator
MAQRELRADARRNRERLLAAAREGLEGDGNCSMEDIARMAGVSVGTMYRNWPGRAELVQAVYHEDLDELQARARRLSESEEPWAALASWLDGYVRHSQANRTMLTELTLAFEQRPDLLTQAVASVVAAADAVLTPAQACGAVRPDLEAADLIAIVSGMVLSAAAAPERHLHLLAIVLDGIRAPAAGRPERTRAAERR